MWVTIIAIDEDINPDFEIGETYSIDDDSGELWIELGLAKDGTEDMEFGDRNIQSDFHKYNHVFDKLLTAPQGQRKDSDDA